MAKQVMCHSFMKSALQNNLSVNLTENKRGILKQQPFHINSRYSCGYFHLLVIISAAPVLDNIRDEARFVKDIHNVVQSSVRTFC